MTDNDSDNSDDDADDAVTDEEDSTELDPSREAFDEETIEDIISRMAAEDALSPDEERIGRTAVTKVSSSFYQCTLSC